jgi:nucleotide-binding universal stress UspA family protein
MLRFDNILVPTDFSKHFFIALDYAKEMARSLGAKLHVIHCIESTIMPSGMVFPAHAKLVDVEQEIERNAKEKIQSIKESLESEGYNVITSIKKGSPAAEIIEYASKNDVGMICISTHGASGLEHFIFGSTTEKVLRTAKCPVFAVKIP